MLRIIKDCNIESYSIYYKDGFLFSYFEYTGDDYEADMAKMAADPETQRWWAVCEPCQEPLDTREEGEWWAQMEEVFHLDSSLKDPISVAWSPRGDKVVFSGAFDTHVIENAHFSDKIRTPRESDKS